MAITVNTTDIISFKKRNKYGEYSILSLNTIDKEIILKNIQRDWKELIRLHFTKEASISGGVGTPWKEHSVDYAEWKRNQGLSSKILEASSPSLMRRYQQGIKFKANGYDFYITMPYPDLISGPERPVKYPEKSKERLPMNAGIHQLGQVKRRIIKKDFVTAAQNRIIEFFTNR